MRYLQKLCGTFDLLPSSFLLPRESVKVEAAPFDSGGYSSVFKATFKGRAIVIKVLNVAAQAERERLHRVSGPDLESPKRSRAHYICYSSSSKRSLGGSGSNTITSCRSWALCLRLLHQFRSPRN